MKEKISDEHIRKSKVEKLKTKILSEIEKLSTRIHDNMTRYLSVELKDEEEWEYLITQEFSLRRLKIYVESPGAFMSFERKDENLDLVIYQISSKYLDIWLQESYNFVLQFLMFSDAPYLRLCDRFFGYEFTNIIDIILYDKKVGESDVK